MNKLFDKYLIWTEKSFIGLFIYKLIELLVLPTGVALSIFIGFGIIDEFNPYGVDAYHCR